MKRKSHGIRRMALLTAALLLVLPSTAWAYKKVRFENLRAPAVFLENVDTVAVLPFYMHGDIDWAKYDQGSLGRMLLGELVVEKLGEDWIESRLGESFATGLRIRMVELQSEARPLFRVVGTEETTKAIIDGEIDPDGGIGELTAAEIGRAVGAQAVLWGDIEYSAGTKIYKDKEEDCRRVGASAVLRLRVIDSESGHNLALRQFHEKATDSGCGAQRAHLPRVEEQIKATLARLMQDVPAYVTPHVTHRWIELQKVRNREFREGAEQAAEAARANDLEGAIRQFQALIEEHGDDHRLHYNLGVVYEALEELDLAVASYQAAAAVKSRKLYRYAVERIHRRSAEMERLVEMGLVEAEGQAR